MFRDVGDSNYRIRKLWLLLLICLATTILSACASGQTQVATSAPILPIPSPTKQLPEDWQFRWSQGTPCQPPCWEGIAVGQSTADDATEILKHNPLVTNVVKQTDSLRPEIGSVTWDWANGRKGGEANYHAQTASEIIYQIKPRYSKVFRLHDIIQAFGLPSHVVAQAQRGPDIGSRIFYEVWIVYLSHGFAIYDGSSGKMDLSEDASFRYVIFFTPTREGLAKSVYMANAHPEWIIPWQGFRGFEFYCRDMSNGRLCEGK